MIRVLHLQTHLPSSGNAAFRLHSGMRASGIDSRMLSLTSEILENDIIVQLNRKATIVSFINQKCEHYLTKKSKPQYGLFSYPLFGTDISKHDQVIQADVIYIHWAIGGFLNLKNIEKLAKLKKPIIFFMHDMW